MMKKIAGRLAVAVVLLAAVLALTFAAPMAASAQSTSEYPFVANLEPFSPEANYMSLPGYLRYLVWEKDGIWLSRAEAVAVVESQESAASR